MLTNDIVSFEQLGPVNVDRMAVSANLEKKTLWDLENSILVMLNKLRCHAHFQFSANQII